LEKGKKKAVQRYDPRGAIETRAVSGVPERVRSFLQKEKGKSPKRKTNEDDNPLQPRKDAAQDESHVDYHRGRKVATWRRKERGKTTVFLSRKKGREEIESLALKASGEGDGSLADES